MKITFLGATRTVTGSCYLIEVGNYKFLIDCGMFQGMFHGTDYETRNLGPFSFNPSTIRCILLTHSHLDHCGLVPKLFKEGFNGTLYTTIATREIVEYMLFDSAKIQEMRRRDRNVRNFRGKKINLVPQSNPQTPENESPYDPEGAFLHVPYSDPVTLKPLYDSTHVVKALENSKAIAFNSKVSLTDSIKFTFIRAAHALGAASVILEVHEGGKTKTIIFSGDLGSSQAKLDTVFDFPRYADYVIMESLYGNSTHIKREEEEKVFVDIINRTLKRSGNIVIPSFSIQRSQELLYTFKTFFNKNLIPSNTKVYLDSPLSIRITEAYKSFYKGLNPDIVRNYKNGNELFHHPNFVFLIKNKQSMKIRQRKGSIIIAGQGMCMGGRIIYHLLANLADERSSIIFPGFQAEGTLGREITSGAKEVVVEGERVKVKAEILRLFSYSAHADKLDLLKWLSGIKKYTLKNVFLIHAEEAVSEEFQKTLKNKGYKSQIPEWKGVYEV